MSNNKKPLYTAPPSDYIITDPPLPHTGPRTGLIGYSAPPIPESQPEDEIDLTNIQPNYDDIDNELINTSQYQHNDILSSIQDTNNTQKPTDILVNTIKLDNAHLAKIRADGTKKANNSESTTNKHGFFSIKKKSDAAPKPSITASTSTAAQEEKTKLSPLKLGTCKMLITIESAEGLTSLSGGVPDAYVSVALRGPYKKYDLFKTEVIKESNPAWNETKKYQVDVSTAWYLDIRVLDKQAVTGDSLIGEALVPFTSFSKIPFNSTIFLLGSLTQASSVEKANVFPEEKVKEDEKPKFLCAVPRIRIFVQVSECNWANLSSIHKPFYEGIKHSMFQIPVFKESITDEKSDGNIPSSPDGSSPSVFCIPGAAERCEAFLPDFTVGQWKKLHIGDLYFTNYRLVFFAKKEVSSFDDSNPEEFEDDEAELKEDDSFGFIEQYSFATTYSNIFEVSALTSTLTKEPKSRFTSLRRSGIVKMESNSYILKLEDFREVRLIFPSDSSDSIKQLQKTIKRVLDHKRVPNRFFPVCQQLVEELRRIYPHKPELFNLSNINGRFLMKDEFKLQSLPDQEFSFCNLNVNYDLCASYPSELFFPASCTLDEIKSSADFRGKNRLPALTYYNDKYGCCIARSGQPHTGLAQKNCKADETLIAAFRNISLRVDNDYLIYDARSGMAAGGNKLKGMGFEDITRYEKAKILFMGIANIHGMRQSIDKLRSISVSKEAPESTWLSDLQDTKWLQHLHNILLACTKIVRQIATKGTSILTHCSDGWDRTAQLCGLTQILLDSRYRTFQGFRVIVEKDFLSFGHKFEERLGEYTQPEQRAPVFLQFLDCVHQLIRQFPSAFEFTTDYLVVMGDHLKSGWFGTFLYNTERQRKLKKLNDTSFSVWAHLDAIRELHPRYTNQNFDSEFDDILIPVPNVRRLELWAEFYLRYDSTAFESMDNLELESISAEISSSSDHTIASATTSSNPKTSPVLKDSFETTVKDEQTKCNDCKAEFSLMKRKHNCRMCGGSFCFSCLTNRLILQGYGQKAQKVCKGCFDYSNKVEERKRDSVSRRGPKVRGNLETLPVPSKAGNTSTSASSGLPSIGNR